MRGLSFENDFRWRGERISRVEAFSDAVFAFAVTLLIATLEVPTSFADLAGALWRFPGFAISFLFLMMIWYGHYIFFRRYGLEDMTTLVINGALLFVVLFYVYPLRFLWALLAAVAGGASDWRALEHSEWTALLIIYGAGMMAVYGLLALLVRHALAKAAELELDEYEVHKTRDLLHTHLIQVAGGATSILVALLVPSPLNIPVGGWIYGLLFPAHFIHARRSDRIGREIRERLGDGAPA